MRSVLAVLVAVLTLAPLAAAAFPYPPPPPGVPGAAFEAYAALPAGALPNDFDPQGQGWRWTSEATGEPNIDADPRELFGVKGMSVDRAWERSTGRADVVIAVLDSGIKWGLPDLINKAYLNRGELPFPAGATAHDADASGTFDVRDYALDPRVTDRNGNGVIDAQDLIRAFSNGVDDDGNGYVDDISGWDFVGADNDAFDNVDHGHGSGRADEAAAEADNALGAAGACPNCMVLHVRVGMSFVTHSLEYALGVLFAVDSGASVVAEALGTIDNVPLAEQAMRYAWENGVTVIASAADEQAFHHNYPAANEHGLVVNSLQRFDVATVSPRSYLYLSGCTNWGANVALSVSGSSCSSESTGNAAGLAGLVVSHAANAVARGELTPYPRDDGSFAPFVLSANEVRQLLTQSADDIDLSTDRAVAHAVPTVRYPTTPGFDVYTGYGRPHARHALDLVTVATMPPEAEVLSPRWFDVIDPAATPTVTVTGLAAAQRATSFDYVLAFGCGDAPTTWTTVSSATGVTTAFRDAPLGVLDVAAAHATCGFAAPLPVTPQRFTVTLKLTVTDDRGNVGDHRKTFFVLDDATAKPGFPLRVPGSGEASPRFADLDGDRVPELLVPTSAGAVHALRADGTELPGWPVRTDRVAVATASRAFASGAVPSAVHDPVGYGGVGVAEDAGRVKVFAGTLGGAVHCWHADATPCPGWPVRADARFAAEAVRNEHNTVLTGFTSAPVLVDLDDDSDVEVVLAGLDRHLYAWHTDGTPVAGYPFVVADTTQVDVDPVTHAVTPKPGVDAFRGAQILGTPTVADLDGDGDVELVIGTNEAYAEPVNAALTNAAVRALDATQAFATGNGRVFAFHGDGTPVAGWPFAIALLNAELLPYVGEGVPGSAAAADVDGDGADEVAIFGAAGPAYLLRGDGTSYFGADPQGRAFTFATETPHASPALDTPTVPAVGVGTLAPFTRGGPVAYVAPTAGLGRALDVLFVADQLVSEDHVTAWDARTGAMLPGFPAVTDDLQFLTNPAVVDVDNDGVAELVSGSGGYLVHAFKAGGVEPTGFPKFTGGWVIATPTVADFDADGSLELAVTTREGFVFVWELDADVGAFAPWGMFHGDLRNTGRFVAAEGGVSGVPLLLIVAGFVTAKGAKVAKRSKHHDARTP